MLEINDAFVHSKPHSPLGRRGQYSLHRLRRQLCFSLLAIQSHRWTGRWCRSVALHSVNNNLHIIDRWVCRRWIGWSRWNTYGQFGRCNCVFHLIPYFRFIRCTRWRSRSTTITNKGFLRSTGFILSDILSWSYSAQRQCTTCSNRDESAIVGYPRIADRISTRYIYGGQNKTCFSCNPILIGSTVYHSRNVRNWVRRVYLRWDYNQSLTII